ncbi:MAG: hypothetical protein KTR15_03635 [Phycisphaeraceae bacterium]|nr:hypothetical protein [Phycisphaeraceae bacterium]
MFKCKQCGRGFSANTPKACPDCGAANRQPDDQCSWKLLGLITAGAIGELLIIAILVGIVAAIVIQYVLP